MTPSASLVNIPGTTTQYYSGYLLSGYLESIGGGIAVPLTDSNASDLGLPAGSLLITPGLYTSGGGTQQIAAITADVSLSQPAADTLFGFGATHAWAADAMLVITNNGTPITLGLGQGSFLPALTEALSGDGPVQTGGVTLQALLDQSSSSGISAVPEPCSAALMLAAVLSGGAAMVRYRSRKS